jgi:DNA mismatch endonuclease (patch repair protein)
LDNISKEKRSKIMSSIHSKDTKPEITLRDALSAKGLKFETNYGSEKIDIAFPTDKLAIFIDGCFWHGCPIHSHKIGTNEAYWQAKLQKNKERDKIKTAKLKSEGWIVLRFWEHELTDIDTVVSKIQKSLQVAGFKG